MSDKVLEAVEGLGKTIETKAVEHKKEIDEQKAAIALQKSEFQKLMDEVKQKNADEVKALNEELTKSGATLAEIKDQVKQLQARSGRFKGGDAIEKKAAEVIADEFETHYKEIQAVSKNRSADIKIENKAAGNMTAAANLTGNVVATYDLMPAVRGRRKINFRDLVPVINSATGVWKFYRENTPVGQGSLSQQTTHASVKSQLDYALTEVTVTADYLAGFVRFAKQMAQDLPFLQNFIANELVEDYKRSESGLFLPTLCSAASGSTAVNGSTVLAEQYIYYIANLMANDYNANAIITTAVNWATVLNTKPNNYSIPGAVQIAPDGTVLIAGVPLIAQNNMPAGKSLVGDFTKAAIIQTEGLSVNFYEQDSDNVQRNLITAKIEARVGLAILRPDAFIYN
jgi:HK97 family phage major capsid protein